MVHFLDCTGYFRMERGVPADPQIYVRLNM